MRSPIPKLEEADELFETGSKLIKENYLSDCYSLFEQASKIYEYHRKWEKCVEAQHMMITWLQKNSRFAEAQFLGEAALITLKEKLEDNKTLKWKIHAVLSNVFLNQEKYEEAKPHAQHSFELAKKIGNIDDIIRSHIAQGNLCTRLHQYHKALSYYFEALKISKKNKVEIYKWKYSYLNISIAYRHLQQYHLAINYMLKAHDLFEKYPKEDYFHIIMVKGILGELHINIKNYTNTEKYLNEAIELCEKKQIKNRNYANLLLQVAELHLYRNQWELGEHYLNKSLAIQNNYNPNDYTWHFVVYNSFATIYMQSQKWEKTKLYLEKVEKIALQLSQVVRHYYSLQVHKSFALLYARQEFWTASLFSLQEALKHWKLNYSTQDKEGRKLLFELHFLQITALYEVFKKEEKLKYLYEAIALIPIIESLINEVRIIIAQKKDTLIFHEKIATFYRLSIDLLYTKYQMKPSGDILEKMYYFSEKSKSNHLLTTLKNAEALQWSDVPSEVILEFQELQGELTIAEKKLTYALNSNESHQVDLYAKKLTQIQISHHQFVQELEEKYPEYLKVKHQLYRTNIKTLQNTLPNTMAIIEYELTNQHLFIFCLTKTSFEVFCQDSFEEIPSLMEGLIGNGIIGLNRKELVSSAFQLYQLLMAPCENTLKKKQVQNLLLIPGEMLLKLPFEVLLTSATHYKSKHQQIPYLIKDYTLQYHYASTLWYYQQKRLESAPNLGNGFLGFAPIYSKGKISSSVEMADAVRDITINGYAYQSLLHSEREVKDIQQLFQKEGVHTSIFLHEKANLEYFKKSIEQFVPRYLHIAAHSLLNEKDELEGILFSPQTTPNTNQSTQNDESSTSMYAKRDSEFSIIETTLFPQEVSLMKINADLLFISSCKSGIGKIATGEGMLSINRSFLYAGVSNIVFTLFKIYDSKTPILTQHFYRALLKEKKSYAAALQYAKLQMIEAEIPPKFWSGFLLLGAYVCH